MKKTVEHQGHYWALEPGESSCRWIATCDELGISMEADSLEEMPGLLSEAVWLLGADEATNVQPGQQ